MKNKILGMASITFIAVLTTINVNFTSLENDSLDLASLNLINTANAEDNELNWPWQWNQGLTKDEREWERPCPDEESSSTSVDVNVNTPQGGGGIGGSHSSGQSNSGGRTELQCPFGYDNCTSIDC